MEIRANYILVGLFTLAVILGAVFFALWAGSDDKNVKLTHYDISVKESVRGLSVNSDVLFIGIRVGKVQSFKISNVTPGEVKVRIAIASDTPVREDSYAQLNFNGITGGAVIAISGGTTNSPLKVVAEEGVGEIRYEPSPLSSVVEQMPDIMASASEALKQLKMIFSKENAATITAILDDVNRVSSTLAKRSKTIDEILSEAEKVTRNFDLLAANANEALVTDVKHTTRSMNRIAKRVDQTLSVMEPGLKQFSTQGLSEIHVLMVEMRNLVQSLTRLSRKMESDPRRFFFGKPVKEFSN